MNDARNAADCSKCHNTKCTLSQTEMRMTVCTGYKPWTNYDRIHDMGVESLAEWLDEDLYCAEWCDPFPHLDQNTGACALEDCKPCIVKWLNLEVKDGTSYKVGRKE